MARAASIPSHKCCRVQEYTDYKTMCLIRLREWGIKAVGVILGLAGLICVSVGLFG